MQKQKARCAISRQRAESLKERYVISGTHPRRRAVRVVVMTVMAARRHNNTQTILQPNTLVNDRVERPACVF
jgi:hypothetical protein